ncbi:12444_t:CDS:2 [Entrophospora sp. SA101]|nr:8136_t:CDS:2 [Entrophospora sp. SA101]CAJ0829873.1 12444_t:CDS:2 [Entrophospora sp. SA101]
MAEKFPLFVGIDIVIDLNNSKKELSTNLAIIGHNVFDGLPFPNGTFDFVNQKSMSSSVTIDQWSFVIDELIRITKSGGHGMVGEMMRQVPNDYSIETIRS